jgi:CBS-domain-containing membrane protein
VNDPDIARAEIEESCRGVLTAESCGTLLENLEQNFRHLEYDQNCANDVEPIDCNLDSLVHQEFLHALKFHNNRLENQDITSNDITSADLEASLENIQALCEQKK